MRSSISLSPKQQSQHRWSLSMRAGRTKSSIETFTTLIRNFATLGDAGAFVSSGSDDRSCVMRIVRENHTGDSLEFFVDVAYCDLRYAHPLRNAMFALGEALENPVLEFQVTSANGNPGERIIKAEVNETDVLTGDFYPELSTTLGVEIQKFVPANYRSGRRVSLICANELSVELITDLLELVDLWASVLVSAYPTTEKELQNGETMILNMEGSQHDEVTFEVLVDRFIACESAFSSLLNLLVIRVNRDNGVSKVFLE